MNIFLFHRDLRLVDNTTLIHQLLEVKESVIPIFIFPPEQIDKKKNKYFSNNSVQFMIECLHELSDIIKDKGGKIYFFKGDTIKVLSELHKSNNISSIGFNIDYTPYARKRDSLIRDFCKDNNIKCYEKEDYVLYDIMDGSTLKQNGEPYLVFTPFYKYCMKNLKVREVNKFNKFKFKKVNIDNKYLIDEKDIDDFYEENNDTPLVHGGRTNGLKILSKMDNFKNYEKCRDILTYKTTFLSAYNKFTPISIREVYFKMVSSLGKSSGLVRELHWRDFYLNVVYFFPHILNGQVKKGGNKSLKEEYDKIKWSYNKTLFNKWCLGQTGYPIIDAAMRQLNQSGFMHNRMRMVTSSFLTKDLHIDWTWGEQFFANKLVDYEPTMNNQGWQWSTGNGADPQPYFRIFNPWTQAIKYDPDCEYIKHWLPELKDVDNKDILSWDDVDIRNKWLKSGINYYHPVVEHDKERLETIKIYKKALK